MLLHAYPRCSEDEVRVQSHVPGGHCGGAAVVALDASNCDHGVGALGESVGNEELELAHFVAAQLHATQVVSACGKEWNSKFKN